MCAGFVGRSSVVLVQESGIIRLHFWENTQGARGETGGRGHSGKAVCCKTQQEGLTQRASLPQACQFYSVGSGFFLWRKMNIPH